MSHSLKSFHLILQKSLIVYKETASELNSIGRPMNSEELGKKMQNAIESRDMDEWAELDNDWDIWGQKQMLIAESDNSIIKICTEYGNTKSECDKYLPAIYSAVKKNLREQL
jgi:hypothetical protein